MSPFIFTFPGSDTVRRLSYVTVHAVDEVQARLTIIEEYGRTGWAFCYPSPEAAGADKYGLTEIEFGT